MKTLTKATVSGTVAPPLVGILLCLFVLGSGHASRLIADECREVRVPVNERQGDVLLYPAALGKAPMQASTILISLGKQRAWLMVGNEIAVDTPIASGRKEGWTPKGSFCILDKDPNHHSSKYGDLVDASGTVLRKNVTAGVSGGIFRGASMKWFLRLNEEGVGMHAGYLPGVPASHGCIRLPREAAERIYKAVLVGTPVIVTD